MKWWLGRNAVHVSVSERGFRSYYFKPLLPLNSREEKKKYIYICDVFIGSIGIGSGEIEKEVIYVYIYIRRFVKSSGLNG